MIYFLNDTEISQLFTNLMQPDRQKAEAIIASAFSIKR